MPGDADDHLRRIAATCVGSVAAFVGGWLLSAAPLQAQASSDEDVLKSFHRLSAAAQQHVLDDIAERVRKIDALALALLECAAAAHGDHAERTRKQPLRTAKRVVPGGEQPDAGIAARVRYVFGVGVVEAIEPKSAAHEADKRAREAELQQALRGLVPGVDAALAELMHALDTDTAADEFAAFLHSWRNGPESFYEALDRTAGTPDTVFFYDAMLADFVNAFASPRDPRAAPVNKSLKAQHAALHAAFLAYRQYRGFREAVAWSLVLPPAVPLPPRLARYEQKVAGAYSLREQVVMLCEDLGGDPRALVAQVVANAPRLPERLWLADYDPYPAWQRLFDARLPHMVASAGGSDALLARAWDRRRAMAAAIAAAARQATDAVGHGH